MSIQVGTHARIGVKPGAQFQYIREVLAEATEDYNVHSSVREKLCSSSLQCQKGMTPRAAVQCLSCPRLVNFIPKDDSVLVRCLWTDRDKVEDLMTLESQLVSISPSLTLLEAEQVANDNELQHLLVVEEGRLMGILNRCELNEEEFGLNTISDRVSLCPWTISPTTTLAQAAQLMVDRHVNILPVVANREVLGVVTRGDLRRAGVLDSLLDERVCG
jgi:CBS domain-containing protein